MPTFCGVSTRSVRQICAAQKSPRHFGARAEDGVGAERALFLAVDGNEVRIVGFAAIVLAGLFPREARQVIQCFE